VESEDASANSSFAGGNLIEAGRVFGDWTDE
jgi:hypothetical protein